MIVMKVRRVLPRNVIICERNCLCIFNYMQFLISNKKEDLLSVEIPEKQDRGVIKTRSPSVPTAQKCEPKLLLLNSISCIPHYVWTNWKTVWSRSNPILSCMLCGKQVSPPLNFSTIFSARVFQVMLYIAGKWIQSSKVISSMTPTSCSFAYWIS